MSLRDPLKELPSVKSEGGRRQQPAESVALIQKPAPIAGSILWEPALLPAPEIIDDAVFITQGALREVSRHIWTAPDQEVLGFLLGERLESPETGLPYVVISATTRSSYIIAEDGGDPIPEDAWQASSMESRRRKLVLLGWYHSAPFLDEVPAPRDLASHRQHFTEPWQMGLVVAPSGELPAGGFFRPASDLGGAWIPFYEVVDEGAIYADGRKRTVTPWKNYVTNDATETTTKVAVARPNVGVGPIPVLKPRGHLEEQTSFVRKRARPGLRMSAYRRRERRKRIALTTLAGVIFLSVLAYVVAAVVG
ncbi:MAG: hypothetical protein H7Z74_02480 [Anaerolineae bacterium]|nr:hypothetical protein [Gemmatimonadaceae bacterium]